MTAGGRGALRIGLARKAILLLAMFGVVLGFILWQSWSTTEQVARSMADMRLSMDPALQLTRDLVQTFHEIGAGYEQAVMLGERGLIDHNQEAVARFRETTVRLRRIPGSEAFAVSARQAFDAYHESAQRLSMRMFDSPDILQEAEDIAGIAVVARDRHDRAAGMLDLELQAREASVATAMRGVEQRVAMLSTRILWSTLPVLLLWIVTFAYLRRRVVQPLVRLSAAVGQVARGDLRAGADSIPAARDEIGELVESFASMREGLLKTTVSKEFLGRTLDAIEEAVIVVDAKGRIRRINRGTLRLSGYEEADLLGQPLSVLDPGAALPTAPRADASPTPPVVLAKGGARIPVSISISPLPLDDGGTGAVLVIRDIGAQLEAESQRRQLERQLHQSAKLESVGQLAAGIAHEINTPIQYVGDNTRFLQGAFASLLGPLSRIHAPQAEEDGAAPIRETIEEIRRALDEADATFLLAEIPRAIDQSLEGVTRVTTIVRAMKEFSHPASEKARTDLNHAIETTLTVARNEWKYVAEVETDLDPSLAPVDCFPGEFNQVVLNMVVNAAHAIASAGGNERKGLIRITTRERGDAVEITITDNGTGIPESIRNRIFDPFFTTKGVGKGTGQGLSIAHDVICRKHGGTLDVESVPGEGATFRIRIPRAGAPAATRAGA